MKPKALLGLWTLAAVCVAVAQIPGALEQHQPRTLGNQAVMHVYWYAPKSLEVTYVDSWLFKDEDECKAAIPKALLIAAPTASEGDLVRASCVGMHPPKAVTDKPLPKGSSEL